MIYSCLRKRGPVAPSGYVPFFLLPFPYLSRVLLMSTGADVSDFLRVRVCSCYLYAFFLVICTRTFLLSVFVLSCHMYAFYLLPT